MNRIKKLIEFRNGQEKNEMKWNKTSRQRRIAHYIRNYVKTIILS